MTNAITGALSGYLANSRQKSQLQQNISHPCFLLTRRQLRLRLIYSIVIIRQFSRKGSAVWCSFSSAFYRSHQVCFRRHFSCPSNAKAKAPEKTQRRVFGRRCKREWRQAERYGYGLAPACVYLSRMFVHADCMPCAFQLLCQQDLSTKDCTFTVSQAHFCPTR